MIKLVSSLSDKHVEQLHLLYQAEWWSKGRSLEETIRCVKGSQLVFGLIDECGDLIAFTRVLTDGVFKALMFDVIVSERARGQHLGERLVNEVLGHEILKSVAHIELYCQPDMKPFYERNGFSSDVGGMSLMRRKKRNHS